MRYRDLVSIAFVLVAAAAATGHLVAGEGPSQKDAASLRQKVAAITIFGDHPSRQVHKTTLTENELNAFLSFDAADSLPAGVLEPVISILGTGRVMARAVVDLDA